MKRWDNSKPIVIVPTMYYKTPIEKFESAGISLVIWANHILRSSVISMQKAAKQIYEDQTIINIENNIVPISEIFLIQNVEEYRQAEKKYLPQVQNIKAIILATSKGENFGTLTDNKPKCMVEINRKTILATQIETLNNFKIKDISIVVGYKKDAVNIPNLKYIENTEYKNRSILYSYYKAKDSLDGSCIISFGDILFELQILQGLINADGDITLAVDTSWWQGKKKDREIDMVFCEIPPSDNYLSERCTYIKNIGTNINRENAHGEWTGLIKLSSEGAELFKSELEQFFDKDKEKFYKSDINDFLIRMINKGVEIKAYYFRGHWLDIDSPEDLLLISNISKESKV